jgi:cellulose synthase/poly-beta-1,6-N-acetylglucosamine synthase-like glycosyltransferase
VKNELSLLPNPRMPSPLFRFKWWMASFTLLVVAFGLLLFSVGAGSHIGKEEPGSPGWVFVTVLFHLPFLAIFLLLVVGIAERIGFYWRGRKPESAGTMPTDYPSVCVQLPMFNEHAVARRVIEAAARMEWQRDRLTIQVLDDSTDQDTRHLVEQVCAEVRSSGIDCRLLHRTNRQGYKAGALEEGRLQTDSTFFVIFDADFVPPADFLLRTIPHFYHQDGTPDLGLALVQAQWGHLNHEESALTLSQSL